MKASLLIIGGITALFIISFIAIIEFVDILQKSHTYKI